MAAVGDFSISKTPCLLVLGIDVIETSFRWFSLAMAKVVGVEESTSLGK